MSPRSKRNAFDVFYLALGAVFLDVISRVDAQCSGTVPFADLSVAFQQTQGTEKTLSFAHTLTASQKPAAGETCAAINSALILTGASAECPLSCMTTLSPYKYSNASGVLDIVMVRPNDASLYPEYASAGAAVYCVASSGDCGATVPFYNFYSSAYADHFSSSDNAVPDNTYNVDNTGYPVCYGWKMPTAYDDKVAVAGKYDSRASDPCNVGVYLDLTATTTGSSTTGSSTTSATNSSTTSGASTTSGTGTPTTSGSTASGASTTTAAATTAASGSTTKASNSSTVAGGSTTTPVAVTVVVTDASGRNVTDSSGKPVTQTVTAATSGTTAAGATTTAASGTAATTTPGTTTTTLPVTVIVTDASGAPVTNPDGSAVTATVPTTTDADSDGDSDVWKWVVGGVGVGVLLLAVGAIVFFYLSNFRGRAPTNSRVNPYDRDLYNNDGMGDAPPVPVNSMPAQGVAGPSTVGPPTSAPLGGGEVYV